MTNVIPVASERYPSFPIDLFIPINNDIALISNTIKDFNAFFIGDIIKKNNTIGKTSSIQICLINILNEANTSIAPKYVG